MSQHQWQGNYQHVTTGLPVIIFGISVDLHLHRLVASAFGHGLHFFLVSVVHFAVRIYPLCFRHSSEQEFQLVDCLLVVFHIC